MMPRGVSDDCTPDRCMHFTCMYTSHMDAYITHESNGKRDVKIFHFIAQNPLAFAPSCTETHKTSQCFLQKLKLLGTERIQKTLSDCIL